jgi:hypothetical protein
MDEQGMATMFHLPNYHVRSDEKEWRSMQATALSVMLRKRWALRWLVG